MLDRASGRLIINDQTLVERLEPDGTLLALAGSGAPNSLDSDTADGVPASALRLSLLRGMAQDSSGALYLAEALQGIVFRVGLDGTVTKFYQAMPFSPRGMVFDSHGNLDIADEVCACIIRLDTAGVKSTVYKLPPSTEFTTVEGLAIDAHDNLFVTEYFGNQVLRIAADGSVTTVAGTGVAGFSGDGGRATEAQLRGPTGIAVASDGTLYIGDSLNNRVRRVTPDGMISTIAGTGVRGFSGDGGPAVAASLNIPAQVVADGGGNLYVADFFSGHVRKVSAAGIITTVAGNGDIAQTDIPFPPVGDGGPAIQATLRDVTAVVADPAGNLVVADFLGNRVRKIAPDGTISSLGAIDGPVGLALDGQGAIYVSTGDSRVRKIDSNGTISLFAGTGTGTGLIRSQGDGGPATSATLNEPKQIAVDAAGNLYIADTSNARLRRVDTKGIIQTVSGPGQQGVDYWNGVAIDGTGTVFVATTHALTTGVFSQVQRLNADGSLTPIAGNGQFCTGNNDGISVRRPGGSADTALHCHRDYFRFPRHALHFRTVLRRGAADGTRRHHTAHCREPSGEHGRRWRAGLEGQPERRGRTLAGRGRGRRRGQSLYSAGAGQPATRGAGDGDGHEAIDQRDQLDGSAIADHPGDNQLRGADALPGAA